MSASTPPANSDRIRQVATIAAILAAFIANVWSNLYPLNGATIGNISNTIFANVQVIPANYAFAIWGLIYLGLLAFGIYQLLPNQRQNLRLRRVGYWLVIACVAQIVWVYLFLARQFGLSVAAMLCILLPLMVIYQRLGIGRLPVSRSEKWLAQVPLSLYLGWISVATVVNVASALVASGWNGWGLNPQGWTIIMLGVSAAIAALAALTRRDATLPLVFIWAFVAIAVRQVGEPVVATVAIGLAIGLLLLLFSQWRLRYKAPHIDIK